MNPVVSEELISAYLDGEVTTDERALVERALADSPDLRRLHQDLRNVQTSLRALPRRRLPVDFSRRITAQIERESLRPLPVDGTAVTPAVRGEATGKRTLRSWQVLAVTAASLAAVLFVAVLAVSSRHGDPSGPDSSSLVAKTPNDVKTLRAPQEQVVQVPTQVPLPGGRSGERSLRDMTRQVGTNGASEDRAPNLVMVMDLTITPVGQTNRVFEDALQRAGIRLDPDIKVDERLEKAILASRFLGDVEKVERGPRSDRHPTSPDEIEMTFVTGPGLRIDAAMKDLQSRPVEFIARWQYDMAIEPSEKDLFRLLDSAVRLAGVDDNAPRAYRLAFRFSMRHASAGLMGNMARPLVRVELVPDVNSLETRPTTRRDLATAVDAARVRPAVTAGSTNVAHETATNPDDELCDVLFILRNLPSASPHPDQAK